MPLVSVMCPALAPRAALHFRDLRTLGITIRKTVALLIGTYWIANGHTLPHRDRDFLPMARHLGPRTLSPSQH
jgi:predicted nucleic acid-binding protein